MYGIYGNIYHQYTPVLLAYIPYMDPMGNMILSNRVFTLVSIARGEDESFP